MPKSPQCAEENFKESRACDPYLKNTMVYNKVQNFTLTLEPRSSCGFFLYNYASWIDIIYQWPVTFYQRDYKTVGYFDTGFI